MIWCNEDYILKFENIEHHIDLCEILKNLSLDSFQNTMFCGVNGCGKKTIALKLLNYLVKKKFNVTEEDLKLENAIVNVKHKHIEYRFSFKKNNYYHIIDFAKIQKKRQLFLKEVIFPIIQTINMHTKFPHLFLFLNIDETNKIIINIFNLMFEKYIQTSRFIIVSNGNKMKKILKENFVYHRIPKISFEVQYLIFKKILKKHLPKKKISKKKAKEYFILSDGNLSKGIFYMQIDYLIGNTEMKQLALRKNVILEKIHKLLISNKLSDIGKLQNIISENIIHNYRGDKLVLDYIKFLIKNNETLYKKCTSDIIKIICNYNYAFNESSKTCFISTEVFFVKLKALFQRNNTTSQEEQNIKAQT